MAFPGADLFNDAMARAESGGRDLGYHDRSKSSAAGRFGITDGTWAGLAKNYPHLGLTSENRFDPAANQRAQEALTAENAQTLRSKGVATNPSTLSLAHFLGPQAASAFTTADPNAPVFDVLTAAVGRAQAEKFVAANPTILGGPRTVGSVMSWNDQRAAGGAPAGPQGPQGPLVPGQVTATQAPPMPTDFGAPGANPASVQVDRTGRQGDPLMALGMGLMSGNGWHDGVGKANASYQQAQAQLAQDQRTNAGLADSQAGRDADAPGKAAHTAQMRAEGWKALNPTISPTDALNANISLTNNTNSNATSAANTAANNAQSGRNNEAHVDATKRGQDQTAFAASESRAQRAKEFEDGSKSTQNYVVPGAAAGDEQHIAVTTTRNGTMTYKNLTTGQDLPSLPPGAQSAQTYHQGTAQGVRAVNTATKDVKGIMDAATAAQSSIANIDRALASIAAPGSNVGPGVEASARRMFATLTGLGTEPQQLATMDLERVKNSVIHSRAAGLGAMSDADRLAFTADMANVATDPAAARRVLQVLRADDVRTDAAAQAWLALPQAEQDKYLRTPGGVAAWKFQTIKGLYESEKAAVTPQPPPNPTGARPQGTPSLSTFR